MRPSVVESVTVYCASSEALEPAFRIAAQTTGRTLAARGLGLVYGGGSVGLMGETARAARAGGGRVTGVITRKLLDLEQGWDGCDEMIVVDSMRERKKILEERGDAFLVLPGGLGTYEEFFEILVGRVLDVHRKPIAIVNDGGYYDPLVALVEHGIEHRFIRPAVRSLLIVEPEPIRAIERLLAVPEEAPDLEDLVPTGGRRRDGR
jgi:uncharacterized protein (TIGR00730 family)